MSKVLIIHHNDLDGYCSAAIIFHYLITEAGLSSDEVHFQEMDYGREFPLWPEDLDDGGNSKGVGEYSVVWIVDWSFSTRAEWTRLLNLVPSVIWRDHHGTAIENVKEMNLSFLYPRRFNFWCREGISATRIVWEELYIHDEMPIVVEMVDRWDTWKHQGAPHIVNFVTAMEHRMYPPDSKEWERLLFSPIQDVAHDLVDLWNEGKLLWDFLQKNDREEIARNGRFVTWEGNRFFAINTSRRASQILSHVSHQAKIAYYQMKDGRWKVELRGDAKLNLGDLAAKYGGGGHPGAAGFICHRLPWEEGDVSKGG
jgi:oligoribonuclease NrnB/cAMP/cGMP phosphodiesterase (DHH superfamily)